MTAGYRVSPSSSREALLDAFEKMGNDAGEKAKEYAYRYFLLGQVDDMRKAERCEGKKEILHGLAWAFSGKAEEEGCDPTVHIE